MRNFKARTKAVSQFNSFARNYSTCSRDATLRDYQQFGLNWLQLLRSMNLGGVLADDMGLGKTVQTLAHLQYEKEQGRLQQATLIIAPTSLVGNWEAEAKRFTPQLRY